MKQLRATVSIAIVDGSELFREGLKKLLHKPRFDVVAVFNTLDLATLEKSIQFQPDIFLFDSSAEVEMTAHLSAIRNLLPSVLVPRLVFLTDVSQPDLLQLAFATGVSAILSKRISSDVLRRSLEFVMLGQRLFPVFLPNVALEAAAPKVDGKPEPTQFPRLLPVLEPARRFRSLQPVRCASPNPLTGVSLSERENQILGCLQLGFSNKMIARKLLIMEATVKTHMKSLLRKLGIANRTQAAIWAMDNQIQLSDMTPNPESQIINLLERRTFA